MIKFIIFLFFISTANAQNLDSLSGVSFYDEEFALILRGNRLAIVENGKIDAGVFKRVPIDFVFKMVRVNTHCFAMGDIKEIKNWALANNYFVVDVKKYCIPQEGILQLIPIKKWECPRDTVYVTNQGLLK